MQALTGLGGHRHIPSYRYASPNGLGWTEVVPSGETAISLDTQTTESGNVAHIYAVPMSLTSTGLSLTGGSDGAESSSDDGYAYTLMMRSDEGNYRYGRSQYLTTLELG